MKKKKLFITNNKLLLLQRVIYDRYFIIISCGMRVVQKFVAWYRRTWWTLSTFCQHLVLLVVTLLDMLYLGCFFTWQCACCLSPVGMVSIQCHSDGQIPIAIWFKSRFEHFGGFDLKIKDSIWKVVIRFVIRFKKFAIRFEFCANRKSFVTY